MAARHRLPRTSVSEHPNTSSNGKPPEYETNFDADSDPDPQSAVTVSRLEPRIATLLQISKTYRYLIYICRLSSILPCLIWGLRHAAFFVASPIARRLWDGKELSSAARLRITLTLLAALWSSAAAYLAYFFTDRLVSRWLINYTPSATVVRILTIDCVFAYLTSWIVYLVGGTLEPLLLLSAWIGIATILTACYHYTQRKILIHKETSASIRVFSIASFISMVALLLHSSTSGSLTADHIPLVGVLRWTGKLILKLIIKMKDVRDDVTWN
ncbi:N-glycosylation protein-domain-containing protein [Xylariaceae sp. FL1019]|nr:N-glycosylation protein-domain-containing protein [Xylariaceae sp. FL1019]